MIKMSKQDWLNILNSVRAKTGKNDLLVSGEVPGEIDSIRGGYSDIPTYHYTESGRVIEKIRDFKSTHPNSLIFGAISDIHVNDTDIAYAENSKKAIKHAAFALEMVGSMAECDFIANLGDNGWEQHIDPTIEAQNSASPCGLENAKYSINALKPAFERLTSFNLVGNHDKTNDTEAQYSLIGVHNDFDVASATTVRGFGYKDYTEKKVRVIVLNTCDYLNASGGCALSYEQKDFLMRALDLSSKSNASSWQILLLSHIPLDWNGGDYNYYTDLQTILTAYENGTTANIAVNSSYAKNETPSNYATYSSGKLTYNYNGKNVAKIIANIHGHVHTNKVSKIANTEIARVSTANTNPDLNKTESYPEYGDYSITSFEAKEILKVHNSKDDTSATFYCIDLDSQIIYAYGYGADIDRTIPYKEAEVYSVTYNLTDVMSSNSSVTVIESTAFTTTLSVEEYYSIDTVTVTMGGVDITSSVYSNGVITIPSVTGNIVITATAIDNYIPVWDIANRTAVTDMYKGANDAKSISRHNYYYGAASTGAVDYRKVTGVSLSGNDVTFTCDTKGAGIGLPYHLEGGASYTFSCTASASARLRVYQLNSTGKFVSGSEKYSSSGTNLTLTFTAPTDETIWTILLLDTNTINTSIKYTNIKLTKN